MLVVLPDRGVLPATTPLLRADSAAVQYGDGVFETVHLRAGTPWLLDAHLDRLARSADLASIPLPPRSALAALAAQAAAADPGAAEGALRLVCTRGPGPEYWATVGPVAPSALRERRTGVAVISAGLGVAARGRPPWLLTAAKSLSYAANLAARRWAAGQGADDLLWTSTDGYVLEAPTASVVWLTGDTVGTVPAADTGILPGTTAAALLAAAGSLGLRAAERLITLDDLAAADAIWLSSALRGLAEIHTLDGVHRARSPWTARLQALLGYP